MNRYKNHELLKIGIWILFVLESTFADPSIFDLFSWSVLVSHQRHSLSYLWLKVKEVFTHRCKKIRQKPSIQQTPVLHMFRGGIVSCPGPSGNVTHPSALWSTYLDVRLAMYNCTLAWYSLSMNNKSKLINKQRLSDTKKHGRTSQTKDFTLPNNNVPIIAVSNSHLYQ